MKKEAEVVRQMFNAISATYDRVNATLSLGIDKRWRRHLLEKLPEGAALQVLDIATGTADQLIALLEGCPQIRKAVGVDIAEKMLSLGRRKLSQRALEERGELFCADALELPFEEASFDCTTITFGIRNVADPLIALEQMHRVLRSKGRALILEFSLPPHPLIKRGYLFYLRHVLPKVGGFLSGHAPAYVYLNQTIEQFPCGEAFCTLMQEAGFSQATAYPFTFGIATLYVGEK